LPTSAAAASLDPTFLIRFDDGRSAAGVRVGEVRELGAALASVGLRPPRPVVVLVGGAGGLRGSDLDRLRPAFGSGLVPVVERFGAVGLDGGTRAGVMRVFGETHSAARAAAPLVGVVAEGTVRLPGERSAPDDRAELDPGHTHVVLVPGDHWGSEAPWLSWTATALAGGAPSVTLLVNGGDIAYSDVERSLEGGRPVIALDGSGRTADQLAAAVRGEPADERAVALAASGLVQVAPVDDPSLLADRLGAALSDPPHRPDPAPSTTASEG
jgi:hypothetical protein